MEGQAGQLLQYAWQAPIAGFCIWLVLQYRADNKALRMEMAQLHEQRLIDKQKASDQILAQQTELTQQMRDQQRDVLPVLQDALRSSQEITRLLDRISSARERE